VDQRSLWFLIHYLCGSVAYVNGAIYSLNAQWSILQQIRVV